MKKKKAKKKKVISKIAKISSLEKILDRFYKEEINVTISSFFDGGWDFKIGDPLNGFQEESNHLRIPEGIEFLEAWLKDYRKKRRASIVSEGNI